MTAVLVPCLVEGRDQLNAAFPNRDKSSDGWIGDQAHQSSSSSHNPDKTGKAEHKDGDSKDEVRAIDVDKDLRGPAGTSMEILVQHTIERARAGKMPWLRYVIYQRRIWHKRDNFTTRKYTGSNPHDQHAHFNSDFTDFADSVTGTDWDFDGFTVVSGPPPVDNVLLVDGELGPRTISKWQSVMGTKVDGKISTPSQLIKAVQTKLNATVGRGLRVDGLLGSRTIRSLQEYLGTPIDGLISKPSSTLVKALQRRLNEGRF